MLTVEQLEKALRSLPDTDRVEVNEVRNLVITDQSDAYLGFIDMKTGEVELFKDSSWSEEQDHHE